MDNDRKCEKCVYHSRGKCCRYNCEGTKTADDVRAEAIDLYRDRLHEELDKYMIPSEIIDEVAEQVKEACR